MKENSDPIKIIDAAIKEIKNGRVWTGDNHGVIVLDMLRKTRKRRIYNDDLIFGFMTNTREFVDRKKAYSIARKSGQLKTTKKDRTLTSSDIYIENRLLIKSK